MRLPILQPRVLDGFALQLNTFIHSLIAASLVTCIQQDIYQTFRIEPSILRNRPR